MKNVLVSVFFQIDFVIWLPNSTFNLIISNAFLYSDNILVEAGTLAHEGEVREDERLLDVKPEGDDVFDILPAEALALFHLQVFPEELLVVCELDDQGNIKHVLEIVKCKLIL